MKKAILTGFVALIVSLSLKGQLNFNMGGGYSSKKAAIVQTYLGYQFNSLVIQGGFIAHVTNEAGKGAVFYGQIGYHYQLDENAAFEFCGGYGNIFVSADDKGLNKNAFIGSATAYLDFRNTPSGAFLAGFDWTKGITTFKVGIRFKFLPREKYGCYE